MAVTKIALFLFLYLGFDTLNAHKPLSDFPAILSLFHDTNISYTRKTIRLQLLYTLLPKGGGNTTQYTDTASTKMHLNHHRKIGRRRDSWTPFLRFSFH